MHSLNYHNKSWKDVNIIDFVDIFTFPNDNQTEFLINKIGVILNISNEEVEDLEYEEFIDIENQLSWTNNPPTSPPVKSLTIQDIDFHLIKNLNSISLGEFIDLEYYFQDGYVKNLTIILAILYRPIKSEESILRPTIHETYDYDPRHRAKLFDEISIDLVYGIIPYYLNWRNKLLQDYHGLFNTESTNVDDEELLEGLSGVEKAEMMKALDAEKKQKKWSWTLFLYALADNDALKIESASKLGILAALNIYSMRQELQLKN